MQSKVLKYATEYIMQRKNDFKLQRNIVIIKKNAQFLFYNYYYFYVVCINS